MKKNLLYVLLWCMLSTPLWVQGSVSENEKNVHGNFVSTSTLNYDPMDLLGILNLLMQYSEDSHIWNYEAVGLTLEDLVKAIPCNPEAILNKIPGMFTWKEKDGYQVLTKIVYNGKLKGTKNKLHEKFDGKFFKNLESISFDSNNFHKIDVSKNLNLVELVCSSNWLQGLDVSNNINLKKLECFNNHDLKFLDVSKNVNLIVLYCWSCSLSKLDVSNLNKLEKLSCDYNNLKVLDLSNNPNLNNLGCAYNKLSTLEFSNNPNLEYLYCYKNNLTSLNVSNNPKLLQLYCHDNKLTSLDVSNKHKLGRLFSANNQIATLNISNTPNLVTVSLFNNQLTSIDVSTTSTTQNMYLLECHHNQLKFSTLKGKDFRTVKNFKLNPQEIIKGGTKGFVEIINLSSEYDINNTITTYTWYDKATNQEVSMYRLRGLFIAGPSNIGKTLICKMKNELFPSLELEYEVRISNSINYEGAPDSTIPSEFKLTGPDANLADLIQVYPNPIIDVLKINSTIKIHSLSVYNFSGKEVKRFSSFIHNAVNLQDIPTGTYLLAFKTDQGIISKIIIKD